MKVLTSKIVNGKKMFLIEDNNPQGKVFAQDGKPIKKENISNYNPYYVDVKGLNASESTKTNLTPATKITPQEIKKIKESPTNVGNIKIKEAQEKAQRLKEAEEAYKKRKAGAPITPELLAQETQAIGDKISLQNIPGVGQYIPDILDVTGGTGSMASGLGSIPLNLNRGNYGQALLSVAAPLATGALAGASSPTMGQFVNNIANPLVGTGDLAKNVLREGVDLIHPVGRQLRKLNKEGLAQGLSPEAIKRKQMEEVGITSLQRKGYFPGVSEIATEYITPYSYDNAKKRILDIPRRIVKGEKNSKYLSDDMGAVAINQTQANAYAPLISNSRYDAWKLYSGMPQKHNTFRIAETSPVNHPSYTQKQLNELEKFSLNNEADLLMDLPNEFNYYKYELMDNNSLLDNVTKLQTELQDINDLQKKGIDFPVSDFGATNVMGGYNRRFFNNKMEYNDIWDLDLNGLKVEKYYGKPFLSHGQLEYSLEPAKNTIERLLRRASNMERDINISKDLKNIPDFNVKNYNFLQDVKKVKRQLGGTIKVLDTKIENNKKYYLINE